MPNKARSFQPVIPNITDDSMMGRTVKRSTGGQKQPSQKPKAHQKQQHGVSDADNMVKRGIHIAITAVAIILLILLIYCLYMYYMDSWNETDELRQNLI